MRGSDQLTSPDVAVPPGREQHAMTGAALGLALTMAGAAATHIRRGENSMVPVNVVLGGLALLLAVMRFGRYSM